MKPNFYRMRRELRSGGSWPVLMLGMLSLVLMRPSVLHAQEDPELDREKRRAVVSWLDRMAAEPQMQAEGADYRELQKKNGRSPAALE